MFAVIGSSSLWHIFEGGARLTVGGGAKIVGKRELVDRCLLSGGLLLGQLRSISPVAVDNDTLFRRIGVAEQVLLQTHRKTTKIFPNFVTRFCASVAK